MSDELYSNALLDYMYESQLGTAISTEYAERCQSHELDYNAIPMGGQDSCWMADCTLARLSSRKHGYGIEHVVIRDACDLSDLLRRFTTRLRLSREEGLRLAMALRKLSAELAYQGGRDRVSMR